MASPKPNSSKAKQKIRLFDGQKVEIILYNGKSIGHGKYFTGTVNGKLICDANNKPLPYDSIGEASFK